MSSNAKLPVREVLPAPPQSWGSILADGYTAAWAKSAGTGIILAAHGPRVRSRCRFISDYPENLLWQACAVGCGRRFLW